MTTEILGQDIVVGLSSPQITSTETIVATSNGGGSMCRAGGVELGRKLLLAARAGDTAAVLDLMAKGAPFTTDWLGTSPLHLAAANNHVETCGVLLRAGVSRDSRTKVERTPLHLAAHAGHARVAALLLEHGARVDCLDMLSMTPLHWAAARGHAGVARELLRRGAGVRARCKFRKTPRALAVRAGHGAVVALLDAAAADAEAAEAAALAEQMAEESPKVHQEFETIQRIQEIKPQIKIKQEKTIVIESKTEPVPDTSGASRSSTGAGGSSGGGSSGSGSSSGSSAGAAALLRAHGITLLPADDGSTVLSALQSGRTVVLSDAGKLMLKESSPSLNISSPATSSNPVSISAHNIFTIPSSVSTTSTITNSGTGAINNSSTGAFSAGTVFNTSINNNVFTSDSVSSGNSFNIGGTKGVVVRAKAVKTAPRGVKVFTLNNRVLQNQQIKKVINPHDTQQVKLVSVKRAPLRLLLQPAGARPAPPPPSPPSLPSLDAHAASPEEPEPEPDPVPEPEPEPEPMETSTDILMQETDNIVRIPEQFIKSSSVKYLRSQLLAAHATIANLTAELRVCKAKLTKYEGIQ